MEGMWFRATLGGGILLASVIITIGFLSAFIPGIEWTLLLLLLWPVVALFRIIRGELLLRKEFRQWTTQTSPFPPRRRPKHRDGPRR